VTPKEQTTAGVHSEGTQTGEAAQETPKTDVIKKEGDKTTVVMDGPLSQIYTRALNIVFSKDADQTPSMESAAIDSIMAASILLDVKAKKDELMKQDEEGLYVYATNNEILPEEGGEVLDNLRIALDHKPAKNIILAVEMIGDGKVTGMQCALEAYALQSGVRVVHSRGAVMSFLKNRLGK
jgi:hypothetical protein